jgi:hypothetical protein
VVVDEEGNFIYWVNAVFFFFLHFFFIVLKKKDPLTIEYSNAIPLSDITKIIMSPDTLILQNPDSKPEAIRAFSLSFSFTIWFDDMEVEFVCPSKSEFEMWIFGLGYLCPQAQVIQSTVPEGYVFHSLNNNNFLRTRLMELSELTDSLMQQAGVLMEIRAKNEKSLNTLLNQVKVLFILFTD